MCDVAALSISRNFLIGGLRVDRDDVPSVEKSGEVRKTAESDVDETVGGAETYMKTLLVNLVGCGERWPRLASLDPYGNGREENGDDAEENVAAAHADELDTGFLVKCK